MRVLVVLLLVSVVAVLGSNSPVEQGVLQASPNELPKTYVGEATVAGDSAGSTDETNSELLASDGEEHSGSSCPDAGYESFTWSYANADQWYTCPSWAACANNAQSPINIVTSTLASATSTVGWVQDYDKTVWGNISNTGHALQVTLTVQNNTITGGPLGDDTYELLQFHWHAPSEHTLDGVQPVAELHAVHINVNNHSELAVVSSMYQLTTDTTKVHSFLKTIYEVLPAESLSYHTTWVAHWAGGQFDAESDSICNDASGYFYTYVGSLTTPPCSGPVRWLIHPSFLYVTQEILDFMNGQIYEPNARPVQAVNGRLVQKFNIGDVTTGKGGKGGKGKGDKGGKGGKDGKDGSCKNGKIEKLATKIEESRQKSKVTGNGGNGGNGFNKVQGNGGNGVHKAN